VARDSRNVDTEDIGQTGFLKVTFRNLQGCFAPALANPAMLELRINNINNQELRTLPHLTSFRAIRTNINSFPALQ
jgi:hypothetical protein